MLANILCLFASVPCILLSGVSNAEFICGKAEDVLPDRMAKEESPTEVVGIADPPRAGLRE